MTLYSRMAATMSGRRSAALVTQGHEYSHQALFEAADQVAAALHRAGLRNGHIVGLRMQRGLPLVSALLACLKLRLTFVPCDLAAPAARVKQILQGAGAAVLITDMSDDIDMPTATLQSNLTIDLRGTVAAPSSCAHGAAYVLFTSGSTGEPKGVVVQEAALEAFCDSFAAALGFTSHDVFLAATVLTFDPFVVELMLPLLIGAQVVLEDPSIFFDADRISEVERARSVTVIQATPSLWRQLLEAGWDSRPGLSMLCGGEALTGSLSTQLRRGGGTLWNLYGPTETVVWATASKVLGDGLVTLGSPIQGRQVHVVERQDGRLVKVARGELAIGGGHLGDGYLADDAKTHDRFVPDPWSSSASAKLYLTGDIVELSTDGSLVFVGRQDNQLKIRGQRVEPLEVERTLSELYPAAQFAVVPRRVSDTEWQLVAFMSLSDKAAVKRRLETVLPSALVPARFEQVHKFPLNQNGKIDRRALLAALADGAIPASEGAAAGSMDSLARIWAEALDLPSVDEHTDFFDAGGDSFKALRSVAKINKAFGVEIDIATLFENPTLGKMRHRIQSQRPLPQSDVLVVLGREAMGSPPVVLVHALDGDFAPYGDLSAALGANHPVLGLTQTRLAAAESFPSVESLAVHYADVLVASGRFRNGATIIGWSFGGVLAYALATELERRGFTLRRVIMLDSDFAPDEALDIAMPSVDEIGVGPNASAAQHWKANYLRFLSYAPTVRVRVDMDYVQAMSSLSAMRLRDLTLTKLFSLAPQVRLHERACTHDEILSEPHHRLVLDLVGS